MVATPLERRLYSYDREGGVRVERRVEDRIRLVDT